MSSTRSVSKRQADDLTENDSTQGDDSTSAADAMPAAAGTTPAAVGAMQAAAGATPEAANTPPASRATKGKKIKYPCGKCDGEVTSGVSCNSCDIWFHDKCVDGMTREFFDCCKKTHELYGFTAFLCKVCRKMFNGVNKAMKEVKADLKSMQDRVMVLEQEKEVLAQKLEKIEKGTEKVTERVEGVEKEVATGMEKAKQEVKNDVKSELAQRDENSSNIAIYGLAETKEDDVEKWREAEAKKVTELVEQMAVQIDGEVAIRYRGGRKREEGAKPRPLIVRIADDETRAKIFRSAHKLSRQESTRGVFISHDLTWQQREDDRKAETARKEEAAQKTERAKNEGRRVKWVVVGARGKRRIVEKPEEEEVPAA